MPRLLLLVLTYTLTLVTTPNATFARAIPDPIAHWAMEDASSLGTDKTGNHNGEVQGKVTSVEGKQGNAAHFEDRSWIEVPYAKTFDMNTFSVAVWVKFESARRQGGILGTRFGKDFTFDLKAPKGTVHADVGDGQKWLDTRLDIFREHTGRTGRAGDIPYGQWRLIVYVIDGDNMECRMHVGGDLKRVVKLQGKPRFIQPGQTLRLGQCSPHERMRGALDEVRVWNIALTEEQVMQLAGLDPADRRELKPDERPVYPVGATDQIKPLTKGNLLLVTQTYRDRKCMMYEFDRQGTKVQEIELPKSDAVEESRYGGLAVGADGHVHFYHGVFDAGLATWNPTDGHVIGRRLPGMSMYGNLNHGHLAMLGHYVFCTDASTGSGAGELKGIVRYNLKDGTAHRGLEAEDPNALAAGPNGLLYSVDGYDPVKVIHPENFAVLRKIKIPKEAIGIAVEKNGNVLIAARDNHVYRVDPAGKQLAKSDETLKGICNIDVDEDGTILAASHDGLAAILDSSLTFTVRIGTPQSHAGFGAWVRSPRDVTTEPPPVELTNNTSSPKTPTPKANTQPTFTAAPNRTPWVPPPASKGWLIYGIAIGGGVLILCIIVAGSIRKQSPTVDSTMLVTDADHPRPLPQHNDIETAIDEPPHDIENPDAHSPQFIRHVAGYQRSVLLCILLQICIAVLKFSLLKEQPYVALGLFIPVAILGLLFVDKLATILFGRQKAIAMSILVLIPLVGLVVMLIINGKATKILQAAGIPVGLMGADLSKLPRE